MPVARAATVRPVPRRVDWSRARRLGLEGVGLSAALLFVFMMGLLPHTDTLSDPPPGGTTGLVGLVAATWEYATGEREGYPYTVHVDENAHWVASSAIQRQDKVLIDDPYTGTPRDASQPFSLRGAVHEVGFRLVLAEIQELTGVPFIRVFQFLPALWMAFTAFCVYAMMRPHEAAVPAAAFVGLIPTTARFLGPAFLVPIGFVLAWLPVALILADATRRKGRAAILLAIVVAWAFFVHLIGGFAAVLLLAGYAVARAAQERRSLLGLGLIAVAPLLWMVNAFESDVTAEADKEEILPIDFSVFAKFGTLVLLMWGVGVVMFYWTAPTQRYRETSAFAAGGVIMIAMIVLSVALDLNRYATYARWHPPFFLTASVPAAVAVSWTARRFGWLISSPRNRLDRLGSTGSAALTVVAVAVLVSPGALAHQREIYYHVIEVEDWARFEVASSLVPDGGRFLSDPWKAPVFLARTGLRPYTWLVPGVAPINGDDYYGGHLRGSYNVDFYILNDITLILDSATPPAGFVARGEGVWSLEVELALQLESSRSNR